MVNYLRKKLYFLLLSIIALIILSNGYSSSVLVKNKVDYTNILDDPNPPAKPVGQNHPRAFIWHDYTTWFNDTDWDYGAYIHWDFGDGRESSSGPYKVNNPIPISYSWDKIGRYQLKAYVYIRYDGNDYWSDWSEPLIINVRKPYFYPLEEPLGPTEIKPNESYTFSCKPLKRDPQGDKLSYKWDFDDGTITDWIGPYDSDETCEISHTWTEKGNYRLRVKAKEINETGGTGNSYDEKYYTSETDWSELWIEVTKQKHYVKNSFFKTLIDLLNFNKIIF